MGWQELAMIDAAQVREHSTREEWLVARRQGVGSSDVPAILGLSSFASRFSVYVEKVEDAPPAPGWDRENEAMRWGLRLQRSIGDGLGADLGRRVEHVPNTAIVRHPTVPHALASLDAIQVDPRREDGEPGILEIKNVSHWTRDRWVEQAPLAYQAQVQAQMWVTGLGWGTVCGLIGGCELVYVDFLRHQDFIDGMAAAVEKFWHEHVLARVPPEPTGAESDIIALRKLYPRIDDAKVIKLPDECRADADEALGLSEQAGAIEKRKREIKAKVLGLMGEAEYGDLGDGFVYRRKWIEKDPQPATGYMDLRRCRMPILMRRRP